MLICWKLIKNILIQIFQLPMLWCFKQWVRQHVFIMETCILITVSTWLRSHHTLTKSLPFLKHVQNMLPVVKHLMSTILPVLGYPLLRITRKSLFQSVMVKTWCLRQILKVENTAVILEWWPLSLITRIWNWQMVKRLPLTWVQPIKTKPIVHSCLVQIKVLSQPWLMLILRLWNTQMRKVILFSQLMKSKASRLLIWVVTLLFGYQ